MAPRYGVGAAGLWAAISQSLAGAAASRTRRDGPLGRFRREFSSAATTRHYELRGCGLMRAPPFCQGGYTFVYRYPFVGRPLGMLRKGGARIRDAQERGPTSLDIFCVWRPRRPPAGRHSSPVSQSGRPPVATEVAFSGRYAPELSQKSPSLLSPFAMPRASWFEHVRGPPPFLPRSWALPGLRVVWKSCHLFALRVGLGQGGRSFSVSCPVGRASLDEERTQAWRKKGGGQWRAGRETARRASDLLRLVYHSLCAPNVPETDSSARLSGIRHQPLFAPGIRPGGATFVAKRKAPQFSTLFCAYIRSRGEAQYQRGAN